MIFGIANSAVQRNQARHTWIKRAVVFSLSCSCTGLLAGAILAAVGGLLPPDLRIAAVSLLALIAIGLGSFELTGRRTTLLQCDRETSLAWVREGPYQWAVKTGAAIGFGATTRIGFPLWYAIPLGSLLYGQPVLGAAIYGTYSIVRGTAIWIMILRLLDGVEHDIIGWLIAHNKIARIVAAGQLLILGITISLMVGL